MVADSGREGSGQGGIQMFWCYLFLFSSLSASRVLLFRRQTKESQERKLAGLKTTNFLASIYPVELYDSAAASRWANMEWNRA